MITQNIVELRYQIVIDYIKRKTIGLTVEQICKKYQTTRRTLRKWYKRFLEEGKKGLKNRPRIPRNIQNKTPKEIEDEIVRIKLENKKLGPKRIWFQIRKKFKLCVTTIYNILVRRGIYKLLRIKEKKEWKRYEWDGPNKLWHIDIAQKSLKRYGKQYIVGILDDYSRKVLACEIFYSKEACVVVETTKRAIENYGKPEAILSDNGKQFTSGNFKRILANEEIKHIRTKVKHPQTNGKIERFFRTLKEECLNKYIDNPGQMYLEIQKFVEYYNSKRLNMGIGDSTPDSKYYQ